MEVDEYVLWASVLQMTKLNTEKLNELPQTRNHQYIKGKKQSKGLRENTGYSQLK